MSDKQFYTYGPDGQKVYQEDYGAYRQYKKSRRQGEDLGKASMILGILALTFFCTFINIPMAIVAVVLGIIQLAGYQGGRTKALIGIATAVASIGLMIGLVSYSVSNENFSNMILDSYEQMFENALPDENTDSSAEDAEIF